LFSIGTIIISNETISLLSISVSEVRTNGQSDPYQGIPIQRTIEVVPSTINIIEFHVKLKISLEEKVYLETYYHHSQTNMEMNETPTKIQVHNLQITRWTLIKEQLVKLNLGTEANP
jgi:hypothetical protein